MKLRLRKSSKTVPSKDNDEENYVKVDESQEQVEGTKLKKDIGLIQAVGIIFGIIVGSGIFVSPVGVLKYSNSVGLSLVMWLVPGIFSLVGALVYAELGVRIPKSGGEYIYVLEAFGGLPAFLVMWVTFVIIGGVTCGANSLVFAKYIVYPFYPDCTAPHHIIIMVALAGLSTIFFLSSLNCSVYF